MSIKLLTSRQIASMLGLDSPAYFIKHIACQKEFPRPVKIRMANGKLSRQRWKKEAVEIWINDNLVEEG